MDKARILFIRGNPKYDKFCLEDSLISSIHSSLYNNNIYSEFKVINYDEFSNIPFMIYNVIIGFSKGSVCLDHIPRSRLKISIGGIKRSDIVSLRNPLDKVRSKTFQMNL